MKSNMGHKPRSLGWVAAAVAFLYIILAQKPLTHSQVLEPLGTAPNPAEAMLEANPNIAYDGERSYEMDDKNGLVWMSDKSGRKALTIFGSPYIAHERSFILRPDQQGLSEIDRSGLVLWELEFGTPVTAASVSASISAWGLLDGSIKIVDGNGGILHDLKPSAKGISSAYPCIYGVAISEKGESVAAIYGLDGQHFVVFAKKGDDYELVYDMKLDAWARTAQSLSFSGDGSSVMGRTADGLVFYDAVNRRARIVHADYFAGEAEISIEPLWEDGFVVLLARGHDRFVGLLRKGGAVAMFPVDESFSDLSIENDSFTLSGTSAISRFKVAKK